MIRCLTLPAVAAVVVLTGCAKTVPAGPVADFTTGNTLVTVTHVPAPTEDGTTVFVTVDGNDAGALEKGGSLTLSMPAGTHDIGGYARSIVGRVTISSVNVTTNSETVKHVVYTVTKTKPEFIEQKSEPVKKAPEQQAPQEQAKQTAEPQQAESQAAEMQAQQPAVSQAAETQAQQPAVSQATETQAQQPAVPQAADAQSVQQSGVQAVESQAVQQRGAQETGAQPVPPQAETPTPAA